VLQRNEWLLGQLMVLAEARGAEVSPECLELYATALGEFPDTDIQAVIVKVAKTKRGEFEKPWPALGDLIEPLGLMRRRRREAEHEAREWLAEIEQFWRLMPEWISETGNSEEELLSRFPRFKGTKAR
jgi:hypothetical protein